MAGLGKKTFSDGEVLSAADVNGYLMDQSIMRFADSTARTAAIGTPTEGMVTYLDDVNQIEVYDGVAWVDQQAPILSEGTAGQYLQSNGTAGSQWVNLEIADDIITTQGDLIVGGAGGDAERLGIGAAETVLTSDGTAVTWSAAAGGAGELYAPGTHTVSKAAGYYLVDFEIGGSADGNSLTEGINNLEAFTTLQVNKDVSNWTRRTTPFTDTLRGLVYADGLFIAAGGSGRLITSPDGITWTARTSSFGATFINAITYGEGLYVAVGFDGKLATSPDGINWTQRTSSFGTDYILNVAYGDGLFVAVGQNGKLATSPDGINWTQGPQIFGSDPLRASFYGNGLYVVAGNQGLATSPDGITWTSRSSGVSFTLFAGTYSGSLFVAVGDSGAITTSPDGITWTGRSSGTSGNFRNVDFADGLYVAVGTTGLMRSSEDAISWSEVNDGFGNANIENVRNGNGLWVACGENGDLETAVPAGSLLLSELPTPIQP